MLFGNDFYYPSVFSLLHCVLTKAVFPYQRVTESDLIGNTFINAGNYNQQVVGSESTELNFRLN
jgi:hypothetical protein